MRLRKTIAYTAVTSVLCTFPLSSAFAGVIEGWNTGNVVTDPVPDPDGVQYSYIYDQTVPNAGASSSGYIKFAPPESVAPGLEVESTSPPANGTNYTSGDVYNCVVASSASSGCNSEFQSGKRFKLDRTAFDPIDIVFNVDPDGVLPPTVDGSVNDGLYKVFQKYGNSSGKGIASFSVGLGFGIGDEFVGSTAGDGLGFVDFGADPANNEFSSLFSHGLFGPSNPPNHPFAGYFSDQRSGFNLSLLGEDLIQSTGIFGDYESLFGNWMSYSMAPDGYFFDHDGDPATDAVLIAHYDEESGQWIMNRTIDADGNVLTTAFGDAGTLMADITAIEDALIAAGSNLNLLACDDLSYIPGTPCLAGTESIEDLAKFNLTYFIDQITLDPSNALLTTAYGNLDTFTLRITAIAERPVATPPTYALLTTALFGLTGIRRRHKSKAQP